MASHADTINLLCPYCQSETLGKYVIIEDHDSRQIRCRCPVCKSDYPETLPLAIFRIYKAGSDLIDAFLESPVIVWMLKTRSQK